MTNTGIFSKAIDPIIIEAAGLAGLDFIVLDREHGPASLNDLSNLIRAAESTNMTAMVRVRSLDEAEISSVLDIGAHGVMVPNINNADQARLAVSAARFHPLGSRGICRFVRSAGFGSMDRNAYFEAENAKPLALQIEGTAGIDNLDEILDVPGYDMIFIGPYDLSQSIGRPGEIEHPEVLELTSRIITRARAQGKRIGAFSDSERLTELLRKAGVDWITPGVDVDLFRKSIRELLGAPR
jgi:4-hydroxy-2-oxoheptanedioate aldolase